jgi:hypothetical protein
MYSNFGKTWCIPGSKIYCVKSRNHTFANLPNNPYRRKSLMVLIFLNGVYDNPYGVIGLSIVQPSITPSYGLAGLII